MGGYTKQVNGRQLTMAENRYLQQTHLLTWALQENIHYRLFSENGGPIPLLWKLRQFSCPRALFYYLY